MRRAVWTCRSPRRCHQRVGRGHIRICVRCRWSLNRALRAGL